MCSWELYALGTSHIWSILQLYMHGVLGVKNVVNVILEQSMEYKHGVF